MKNEIEPKQKESLVKLYFYMQDVVIEIESCVSLLYMAENFIKGEEYKDLIGDKCLIIFPSKGSVSAYVAISRVAFHNIIINIFKLIELFEKKQKLLNLIPNFRDRANKFRKEFDTLELRYYRNKYVAHHSDRNRQDAFLSLEELKEYFCKIIGMQVEQLNEEVKDVFPYLLKYAEKFYSKSNKNSEQICRGIRDSKEEIELLLGCKLDRNISF